jgi:hypothetical protein
VALLAAGWVLNFVVPSTNPNWPAFRNLALFFADSSFCSRSAGLASLFTSHQTLRRSVAPVRGPAHATGPHYGMTGPTRSAAYVGRLLFDVESNSESNGLGCQTANSGPIEQKGLFPALSNNGGRGPPDEKEKGRTGENLGHL